MNRFKGLDLVDRVPKELWTELRNTVQEAVIKTTPKKSNCKNAKWWSEEALQITEERKEAKKQGRKKKMHPTERTVPENSKETEEGFLNEQCREIKENNTMGNTRDLFKKIGNIKGRFHARMGR